ncbi:type II toxin-antitoxin system HipA family toxin [Mumia sp. Pv 4-285]|uniref:type II toxin-antitoxin system HipA family toxin n=1 Tax=Mumia qirimensis TaxID=3234852 RepID=UPI00351CCA46
MTTSEAQTAFVWTWLPGATEPVVAGRLDAAGDVVVFTYGRSYLERDDAVALYLPELPLRPGSIRPLGALDVAGCISDAGPDSWGQRVILARHGHRGPTSDTAELGLLTYLLDSDSDRIGALDFQTSASSYEPRGTATASLEELMSAAALVESGEPPPAALDVAMLRGTSVGGARPKALIEDGERRLIAKFSSTTDVYPVVKAEAVAMELARRVGLDVAGSEVVTSLGRDVLLVERFDRTAIRGERRALVSALTILGLTEMTARYASYADLADVVRARFDNPVPTLHELFSRIVFNVCVGNIDDHARNHAAFWDGSTLSLTPAYDVCPQPRSGRTAQQAMAIGRDGSRESKLQVCRNAADIFMLSGRAADEIIDAQVEGIRSHWSDAADSATLTAQERAYMWERQILNPFVFEDA